MNTIELCEYETYKISENQWNTLLDFDDNYPKNKLFSLNHKKEIKAGRFVGTMQHKGLKVNVYPKLFKTHKSNDTNKELSAEDKELAIRNFMFMLSYGYNFDKLRQYDSAVDKVKDSFFEVLIYIFAWQLMEQLKANPNRSYVIVEEESNYLKGTWRLSEQLAKMPHLKHRFLVSYDEFTDNNELNRIFKYVARMLLFASSNSGNKTLLQNILLIYTEIDDIAKPDDAYLSRVRFTRMNQAYKPIFELAKMFLQNLSSQSLSSKISTFTFMFDMNVLFEQFIAGFIERKGLVPSELEMITQARSKALLKAFKDKKIKKYFILKPDMLFKDRKHQKINKLIVDTKYKLLDDKDEKKYGVSQADAYQMYAYAMKYNCKRVILLYPKHLGMKELEKKDFTFNNSKNTLEIRTVDLCMDLKENQIDLKNKLIEILGEKNNASTQ